MISIDISVRPYVKKYLCIKYGESLLLSKRDHVGILLYSLLQKNNVKKEYDAYMKQYSDKFQILISEGFVFDKGVRYLSSYSTGHFNNFIEYIIKDELNNYVDNMTDVGITQADSIRDFMNKYGFDDEMVPYGSLKKSYQRHLNNLKRV